MPIPSNSLFLTPNKTAIKTENRPKRGRSQFVHTGTNLQMLYIILIVGSIGRAVCDQTLTYTVNDSVLIPYSQNLVFSNYMSTRANESVSQGEVKMLISFSQPSKTTLIPYNIIFFNLETNQGLQCYQNYFNSNLGPNEMKVLGCEGDNGQDIAGSKSCYNLTGCQEKNFTYMIYLESMQHRQNVLIVENVSPQNLNNSYLALSIVSCIQLQASIAWFYGAVALTCLLLISLVFFTGVSLYWILKYRKVKRIYEQFKLTETDYQSQKMRQTMKNE